MYDIIPMIAIIYKQLYISNTWYASTSTTISILQIITLTTPMVGNYGVPDRNKMDKFGLPAMFESSKIHASKK